MATRKQTNTPREGRTVMPDPYRYAALDMRVDGLEKQLSAHAIDTKQQFAAMAADVKSEFAGLQGQLAIISGDLKQASKMQWGPLASFLSLIMTGIALVGGLALRATDAQVENLSSALKETRVDFAAHSDKNHASSILLIADERKAWVDAFQRERAQRLEAERATEAMGGARFSRIEDNLVPRKEHDTIRQLQNEQVGGLRRDVERLSTELGSIYSAKDVVRDLQAEVRDLRSRLK